MQPSKTQRPKRGSWSASKRAAAFGILTALFVVLVVPALFNAAPAARAASDGSTIPYWGQNGLLSCTGNYNDVVQGNTAVTKKCANFCDLLTTAQRVVNFVITLVLFIGVPIMIVWGGAEMMLSAGSEERRRAAKTKIVSAIVGVVIMLSGYLIVNTVLHLIPTGTGIQVSWPNIPCGT